MMCGSYIFLHIHISVYAAFFKWQQWKRDLFHLQKRFVDLEPVYKTILPVLFKLFKELRAEAFLTRLWLKATMMNVILCKAPLSWIYTSETITEQN